MPPPQTAESYSTTGNQDSPGDNPLDQERYSQQKVQTSPRPPPMRTQKSNARGETDTVSLAATWQRKTKQKVSQKFSQGSTISFPTLTTDNVVVEPLTIEINAAGHDIHRMYIDGGASADILYEHCFQRLRPEVKSQLNPATTSLTGFTGEKIWPMGQLRLPVIVGNKEHSTTAWMNFMVIRSPSPYNGIIGRPGISAIRAVPSTAHGMLKFPVDGGIVTIYNTAAPPKECNTVTGDVTQTKRQHATKVTNLKVAIHPDYPEQEVSIGGSLSDTGRAAVCALLQRNLDIFAWEPKHMTGVPRSITEHKLKIRQGYSPVRQKKRGQAPERAKAILEEVHKLVEAGIMREVYYHDWLSNPVMVKKSDGSWRMCVDFTDLNKACPQDCYPLPEIDWKVESLCGYPFKCFLDAYKGYHQIQMAKDDEEKTAFHTSQGVYCYTKMPFGLKNAGATYQRLVDNAFEGQVGRNLEVYVDDLVIKSHTEDELVRDIVETFRALRQINMKLNPKKCTFGATEGMFLGYLIGTDGIKPCPDKTKAVIQLPSPRTMKEVQSLNGKLAGLNRFLSKSADKSLPLFKTLKKCAKKGDFRWTTEAEEAFTQLKQHIAALPTLVAPRPGEELIMYLSATHGIISAVLLTDRDSVQTPVYFVSKALKETEINYSAMEKLILALVFAAKRLRRYFQAHPVAVITDQPIKQVISKPDASGRLQKWSVLLGEHNISYRPRTAVKGQILADFLIEKPETDIVLPQSEVKLPEPWILFTDGSSCVDGSGAGLILTNPEGMEFTYALRFEFTATNNEAEYEALLAGLRIAARMGVRNLEANVDSRLVANHVLGEYVAKEDNMVQYLDKTKSLIQGFDRFTIRQVPRGDNKKADALSKIASTSFAHLSKQVLVEILKNKSISEMEISTVIEEQDPTWMTPIVEFINAGTLPHEQKDARRIRRTAQRFELREGVLYRRSFLQPWLRCVGPIQADYVLREIHAGSCSMHSGPRSVVAKALRSGYYWPTMHRDARDMIKKCKDCQVHRPIPRQPQQELAPITSPWPFHKWGIDIAGPFPAAAGGLKFLIVAIDYFTKWIEAKAVATITGNQVKRFVWDNIVCRFGLPGEIVSDNGKQFCDNPFKDWCSRLSITQRFASVKHPQTNGLVERANRSHEQKDARRIRRTAQRFELREGVLYRRSFLQPWLRCVGPIQADYVLREIHAGSCSMHSGPRSVVARALRSGYYWPTMHRDARDMIRKCKDCQVHRPIPRQPQQELTPITSPWPFHKWGIDIAGPFPVAAGGLKFLIVAIDYFTKWIEAKAVATITGNQVKRFVWDNIVCRFGLPGEIVSDNGKQFCDNPFKDWCSRLSITQRFASVKHPQTNGLVERANRSLGEGIKARLDRHKGRWVEELSHVLWAHRTTIKVSTGDTPFSLVYGTEAVIPAEIGMPTIRTAEVNITTNDDERRIDLDILEERREQAAIREEKAKLKMKGYYDAKVRGVSFRPGDFVYRANDASHAEDTGKLGPKWEGPYEVTEALGKGAYKLRDMDGRELPRTWNICNLKKCYL
ncbi:reverse transcriptase domain-containing protein [Tanacetum coccineum]